MGVKDIVNMDECLKHALFVYPYRINIIIKAKD